MRLMKPVLHLQSSRRTVSRTLSSSRLAVVWNLGVLSQSYTLLALKYAPRLIFSLWQESNYQSKTTDLRRLSLSVRTQDFVVSVGISSSHY